MTGPAMKICSGLTQQTNNRINVAISRARHGLFILGNAPQLACQNTFWWDALDQLRQDQCLGSTLPMMCERHGTDTMVKGPADFAKMAPLGESCHLSFSVKTGVADDIGGCTAPWCVASMKSRCGC